MKRGFLKLKIKVKKDQNESSDSVLPGDLGGMKTEESSLSGPRIHSQHDNGHQKPIETTFMEEEANHETQVEDPNHGTQDQDDQSGENVQKQLVVYDPAANGGGEIVVAPKPIAQKIGLQDQTARVLPSVGAFTVQCAFCFKWRLIPTKEKYEEIREHILEQPFLCEAAREWRLEASCDDPPDIEQDGSRLWAIDKPNIAQPPPGWERLLRIRAEGSTKFADVYYVAPSGKRFRSMVEIEKFLQENPEYVQQGVRMSQFSFQIPRPLQENYVRKRPARVPTPDDRSCSVIPISWAGPDENTDMHSGQPGPSTSCLNSPASEPGSRPAKKQKKRVPQKETCNSDAATVRQLVNVEGPHP